ncbi:MAG: histidine kinase dimerization/phospho-acceptor domain-containing protein [Eubacteriales bacterium]|nr:histidine kinase dimerization/phospho-acceptor domain-containing protein [Eubacteriales bacterium]
MSGMNNTVLDILGLPVDFLEAIPGGYHLCEDDPEKGYPFVYVSDRFLEIVGWTREEIGERFGNRYSPMVHPDDFEPGHAFFCDRTDLKEPMTRDRAFRILGKDGYVWISSTAKKYVKDGKSYVQAIHTSIDMFVDREEQVKQKLQETMDEVGQINEELKTQLEIIRTVSKVYHAIYYIDMRDYSFVELGLTLDGINSVIGERGEAQKAFANMCCYLVDDDHRESIRAFTDVTTLQERLRDDHWISSQFIGPHTGWAEGIFIPADRDENGDCRHVIWAVRNIQEEMLRRQEMEAKLLRKNQEYANLLEIEKERTSVISSMANVFYCIYYIDMNDYSFVELGKTTAELGDFIGQRGNAARAFLEVGKNLIREEDSESFIAYTDLSTLDQRLENKDWISHQYFGNYSGWSEGLFIAADRNEDGSLRHVVYAARGINEQKIASIKMNAILEAASQEYHTIWLVDQNTHEMELIRSNGRNTIQNALAMAKDDTNYDRMLLWYVDRYVTAEDQERVTEACSTDVVMREIEGTPVYVVNYKRVNDQGNVAYHQMAFSKVTDFGFTLAFRDIDLMMREEQEKQRILEDALNSAEAANTAKTTFLFNMSHDIRTPMNAIIGYSQLMKKKLTDPQMLDYQEKIEQSGELLLSIINNILDMARIESGKVNLDENCARISDLAKSILTVFLPEAEKTALNWNMR